VGIKGLRDEALPMPRGREVVDDYRSTGLSLRAHPLAFLRASLTARGFDPCARISTTPAGRRLSLAGLVLVRQMPGSAKGVMFVTLEDETANANLIVWPTAFEQHRRIILGASMLGCRGHVQREGGVIHLILEYAADLSADLRSLAALDAPFPLQPGRGDEAKGGGSGTDSREPKPPITRPRDMYEPDLPSTR
jgi:error-prone DNA polymerase